MCLSCVDFVDELVKGYGVGEGVGWMMWVEGCMGKIPKKLHRRLIVVCKYRLLVIKKGGLFSKNALEKELPWFDLIEIREQAKVCLCLPHSIPRRPLTSHLTSL
jgi:hypothetical protein